MNKTKTEFEKKIITMPEEVWQRARQCAKAQGFADIDSYLNSLLAADLAKADAEKRGGR